MAGKFRRKFVDIITDTVTDHYQGKIPEKNLAEILNDIRASLGKLEQCKQKGMAQRSESLRKLKKLPLEKLKAILAAEA